MSEQGFPPSHSATHQEHLVRPQHTNALSSLFGGELMAWIDIAAATCAMRHAQKAVVTASVDALHFFGPIPMGWLVLLDASANYAGRTSCEIGVKVTALHPITREQRHTASAYLTFVALDQDRKPTVIPPVLPVTATDKRRYKAAEERRKVRLELKERLAAHQAKVNS